MMRKLAGVLTSRGAVPWIWLGGWIAGLAGLWTWLVLFLNAPARALMERAFFFTFASSTAAVAFALLLGWGAAMVFHALDTPSRRRWYLLWNFVINLHRSIPQFLGLLGGYVVMATLLQTSLFQSAMLQVVLAAFVTGLFLFVEIADLIRDRIAYYSSLDFVNALLVCGVGEYAIINREILLRNSLSHLVQKSVGVFARSIFLVCTVDFIVSVGLSNEVNLVNFPATLGSILAGIDSKQDILAIGAAVGDPAMIPGLFFEHLQGISAAFLLVFTLLCLDRISQALIARFRL
jgi:ABC-type antimicrobial peptide transport system permease subunit